MTSTTTVTVPGSKSYTNRALVIAAMTPGVVSISGPLASEDTQAMLSCLRTLGIEVRETSPELWEVDGNVGDVKPGSYDLNADQSGTTIRFVLALCCVIPGVQTIGGQPGLNRRPIGQMVDGLRQLGADIEYLAEEGFPPLRVISSALRPGTVSMPGDVSSQYFSALLQVAPLIQGELVVSVQGHQISKPYIDMTIDTMGTFGVTVHNDRYHSYIVPAGQHYAATSYEVEGDLSSAAYFFAIAALTKSTITVQGLNPRSTQADLRFLQILQSMGSSVAYGTSDITLTGAGVRAGHYDMQDCPDQAMTVAVMTAFAQGTTTITGVKSLRIKETERVVAVETELAKMGIRTESAPDTLTVYGGTPSAAHIETYGDHRIAMAFAVATTKVPGLTIANPEVVAKTFPEFWDKLESVRG